MYNMSDEEFEKIRDTIVKSVGEMSEHIYIGYNMEEIIPFLAHVFDIHKCETYEEFKSHCKDVKNATNDYDTYFNYPYECDHIWSKNPMLFIDIGLEYMRKTDRIVEIPNDFMARDLAWQGVECLIKTIIDGVLSDGNNKENK